MDERKDGFVYILVSPKTKYVKIGGTDYPPLKRVKEINSTEPYKSLGPWKLGDFRQVNDWRKIESSLHYIFRNKKVENIKNQKELFEITLPEASLKLNGINPLEIVNKPKVDRMFQDEDFCRYLMKIFKFTGLMNWLDNQGAWTFVLFPSTSGGRYFTLNIGPHEVAYSTLKKRSRESVHMILMDRLILDFDDVEDWIERHKGGIEEDVYERALSRSVSLYFEGDWDVAFEFIKLPGVRRAILAYWIEALIILQEKNTLSSFARFHDYNAIAELNKKIQEI
jgi:hypothetical protein